MSDEKSILITRPEEDGVLFARTVELQGYKTLQQPFLEIKAVAATLPDLTSFAGLIFTSTNAVRHAPPDLKNDIDLPVFCVGARTADAAVDYGFARIMSGERNVEELAQLLKRDPELQGLKLLHIRGEDVADEKAFKNIGTVESLIVYKADPVTRISPECLKALQEKSIQAVTFFSARTAVAFVDFIEKNRLLSALSSIKLLCISGAVLQSVRSHGWAETYAAQTPDANGMLTLINSVCTPN